MLLKLPGCTHLLAGLAKKNTLTSLKEDLAATEVKRSAPEQDISVN